MEVFKKIVVYSSILCFVVFANLQALDQRWSEEEESLWKVETQYWEYWIKQDVEGIMSLIHKDFIGWPSSSEMPSDKKAARKFVKRLLAQAKLSAFELRPAAIKIQAMWLLFSFHKKYLSNEPCNIFRIIRVLFIWNINPS